MRLRPRLALLLLLFLVLALTACDPLSRAEKETVRRWLLCEECEEGEQDSVLALGDRAVGELRGALQGPALKRRAYIRRQTEAMYRRIPPGRIDSQVYVEHFVDNYVATYQSRAAMALARLNTPKAHAALIYALYHGEHYREDVRRVLGESARVLLTVMAGDSQHAAVDSFLRVDPAVLVRDSTNGLGLGNLQVLFLVDSGGGAVSDSIHVTDADGRATVRWRLGPSDSVNVLRAVAAGQVVRFRALGHPVGLRLVFVVQPSNATAGEAITPAVRIAVQDEWGATQVNPGPADAIQVSVEGANIHAMYNLVGGVAQLTNLSIPVPGNDFRIRADRLGSPPAFSQRFEIAP